MLAAMNTATPTFNSPYYETTALLIPVLFLAIAVQGTMWRTLLRAIRSSYFRRSKYEDDQKLTMARYLATAGFYGLVGVGYLALTYGVFGELGAI